MIASGGGGGGGVDQITRPNSASPVISVSAATQSVSNQMINGPTLSAQAASLIGPNLIAPNNTPTPPTVISSSGSTNMAAAQMSKRANILLVFADFWKICSSMQKSY